MGTVLDVSLRVSPGGEAPAREALDQLFREVAALSRVASRFDPESGVSRLNDAAGQGPAAVDPALYEMLLQAESARRATRGAFDVTVGPVVALWTEAAGRDRAPSRDELAQVLTRVGRPIGLEQGRASLALPGMSVDLGGIAKGFALDRVRARLAEEGLARCLLSFGRSSVWAGGQTWRLLIESDDGTPVGLVELRDQALSLSSSLAQSSVIEGVAYGHVVDPRSGQALQSRRIAVVVGRRATEAEVLSTALLVLDEAAGRAVLEEQRAEAWVREEDGNEWQTSGWQAATGFRASRAGAPPAGSPQLDLD